MTVWLRRSDVYERLGLERCAVEKLIKTDPTFPVPVKIAAGDRAIGWVEEEIEEWMRKRMETHRKPYADPLPRALGVNKGGRPRKHCERSKTTV
jgi:predicted DNA-binding transcriptional regulator AlpA